MFLNKRVKRNINKLITYTVFLSFVVSTISFVPIDTKTAEASLSGEKVIFLTSSPGSNQTWTVPDDWSDNNKIEVIGAGGGGRAGSTAGARGGGGGAYSVANITGLSAGGSVTYRVGAGGAGGTTEGTSGANGGDTFFNRTAGTANTCVDTVSVCAKGGTGGTSATAGGAGGAVASNKPTASGHPGGAAGSGSSTGDTGGGGGGAAGPHGAGKTGGAGQAAAPGAGGGGGGTGTSGSNGSAGSTNGGNGGNGWRASGAGTGANATTDAASVAGTNGGGGGGGAAETTVTAIRAGANGGNGIVWTSTHAADGSTPSVASIGPGGGGGGGGATTGVGTGSSGGNGGYGGGGGGAYQNAGAGGQGLIVITYTPNTVTGVITIFLASSPGSNQTWTVPDDWSDNNEIYVIGAGGGGRAGSTAGAKGGGGGAISTSTVTGLSPGGSVTYRVGAGGAGGTTAGTSGANGGDTFFNRTAGTANTCVDTVSVCAKGGTGGTSVSAGGVGGAIASNKPAYAGYNGGAGGNGSNTGDTGGGGGGAAGPYGAGRVGGAGQAAAPGAGGGGGGAGGNGVAGSTTGGTGGVDFSGTGGGTGASPVNNVPAAAGTNGGGGGGGAATTTTTSLRAGANGSTSAIWTQTSNSATIGPGGGGGGGGATTGVGTGSSGGNGGYGGGGGGAYQNAGSGGQGFIVIRYVPAVTNTTTLATGADPASATVVPESSIVDAGAFTFNIGSDTDSVTALVVTLAGSGTPYNGVAEVRITSDDGSTTYFSAVSNPVSNTVNFSGGTPIPVTTTPTQFKIRITPKTHAGMAAVPGEAYALSPYVSDFTSGNDYDKSGTDTNANTLTIDNLSPGNVTSATATAGNTQVSLSWTNPADSDLSKIMVIASTSAITFTPTEGTTYSTTTLAGESRVACYGLQTSCIDNADGAGLTNGTSYYYKIFALDSRGNWSETGVAPTGSPATPANQITYDNSSSNRNTGQSTFSVSHSQGSLTDGYVVYSVYWDCPAAVSISNITYDGTAMTHLGTLTYTPSPDVRKSMYGIAVGDKGTGNYNANITFSSACYEVIGGVSSFSNVDQDVSTGSYVGDQSSSGGTTATVNVSTSVNDLVVDTITSVGSSTIGPDQTQLWRRTDHTFGGDTAGSMELATGETTTMSHTSIASEIWFIGAVPLKPAPSGISLSGTAYQSEGGSALSSKTVKVYNNGTTLVGTDTTDDSGVWSAALSPAPSSGDILTVYIDGDAIDANTVFVSDGTDQTNIDLYGGALIVRDDVDGTITNANLHTGAIYAETDMVYATSTSNAVTLNSNIDLYVWTGDTYAPGATLTTQGTGGVYIESGATLGASGSHNITIGGNFSNNGTFTHNNGTVVFNNASEISIILSLAGMVFNNLTVATPGKTIQFEVHSENVPTFSFDGQFVVTGQNGLPIYIQSTIPTAQWLVDFNVAQTNISNAYIRDSACAIGSLSVVFNVTNSGGGNNGNCWNLTNVGADGNGVMTSTDMGRGFGTLRAGGAIFTSGGTDGDDGGGGEEQTGGDPGGGGGVTP